MKRTKSIMALLLAVVFIFTSTFSDVNVLKTIAAGDATETPLVQVTKTVSDKLSDDGGVDITLTIEVGQKEYVEYNKYDIVVLLDASSSMAAYAPDITNATKQFVKTLKDKEVGDNVRIAVIGFNTSDNYTEKFQYLVNGGGKDFTSLANTVEVNTFTAQGGTPIAEALTEANNLFTTKGREDANKIVVLFTDGDGEKFYHNSSYNSVNRNLIEYCNGLAIDAAATLKDPNGTNAKIYTINYQPSDYTATENVYGDGYYENANGNLGIVNNRYVNLTTDNGSVYYQDDNGAYYENWRGHMVEYTNQWLVTRYSKYTGQRYSYGRHVVGYNYPNAYFFETMLAISSENSGLTKAEALDMSKDFADLSVFKDYYFTTSLSPESLGATFSSIAGEFDVDVIGSNSSVADVIPELFHVDISSAENAVLKSATDNKGKDIKDLVEATYGNDGSLKIKVGTLVVAEDETRSLGNLETGTYTLVYTAKLDDGVTVDDLERVYGENVNNIINIAFLNPAVLTYYSTDEQGNVLPSTNANKKVIESNIVNTSAGICGVSFYINNAFSESRLAMKNTAVAAPTLAAPDDGKLYRIVKWYIFDEEGKKVDATAALSNVTTNLKVYGEIIPQFTVSFFLDDAPYGQPYVVDKGGSVTAPTIVLEDDINEPNHTLIHTTNGWLPADLESLKSVQKDLYIYATSTATESYRYTVNFKYADGTQAASSVSGMYVVGSDVPEVTPAAITGYTGTPSSFSGFTMPQEVVVNTFIYYPNQHNYTIHFVEEGTENTDKVNYVSADQTGTFTYGQSLVITNPTGITGFTPKYATTTVDTNQDNDVVVNVLYTRNTHNVTVHYVYSSTSGAPAAEDYSEEFAYQAQIPEIQSPPVTGHTPSDAALNLGTMGDQDIERYVIYTANQHTVTIHYYYAGSQNSIYTTYVKEYSFGDTIDSVNSPVIEGYTADKKVVSFDHTMGDANEVVDVFYTANTYTVTIHYVCDDEDCTASFTDYTGSFTYNQDTFNVNNPVIAGHSTTGGYVTVDTKKAENFETTVTYTPNEYRYVINYVCKNGETVAEAKSGSFNYDDVSVTIPNPVVNGHKTADENVVIEAATATVNDNGIISVTVTYEPIEYTYVINYECDDCDTKISSNSGSFTYDDVNFSVDSPEVTGHTPEQKSVEIDTKKGDFETTIKYNPDKHTATIHYVYEDGETEFAPDYTAEFDYDDEAIVVPSPEKKGYTTETTSVTIDPSENEDVVVTVVYTANEHKVEITYVTDDGTEGPAKYEDTFKFGDEYAPVATPEWKGYTADKTSVTVDTTLDEDIIVEVTLKVNSYTLTVEFVYEDGTPAAEPVIAKYDYKKSTEKVEVKPIENYTPSVNVVESFVMPAEDVKITVKYVENGKGIANFYNEGVLFGTTTDYVGKAVTAPKDTPTKEATKEFTYVFTGWKLRAITVMSVAEGSLFEDEYVYGTEVLEFDAVYAEIPNPQYTTTFLDWNGEEIAHFTDYVGESFTTPANPTREATDDTEFEFSHWALYDVTEKTIIENNDNIPLNKIVDGDITFIAVYNETEIIDEPEIPQEEPEDPVEVIDDPEIPQTEPEDPVEDIEDPIIPQEDPVVPQTGDKKGLAVVTASAALLLALATLLNKKRK